jgi:hypothetical protein
VYVGEHYCNIKLSGKANCMLHGFKDLLMFLFVGCSICTGVGGDTLCISHLNL